jgi:hypothetical protein
LAELGLRELRVPFLFLYTYSLHFIIVHIMAKCFNVLMEQQEKKSEFLLFPSNPPWSVTLASLSIGFVLIFFA